MNNNHIDFFAQRNKTIKNGWGGGLNVLFAPFFL